MRNLQKWQRAAWYKLAGRRLDTHALEWTLITSFASRIIRLFYCDVQSWVTDKISKYHIQYGYRIKSCLWHSRRHRSYCGFLPLLRLQMAVSFLMVGFHKGTNVYKQHDYRWLHSFSLPLNAGMLSDSRVWFLFSLPLLSPRLANVITWNSQQETRV